MLKHPFSITLFEDWMYWSDWDRNAIFKADKFNGKNAQAVTSTHLVRTSAFFCRKIKNNKIIF
jgi:hypothetical protein